MLQAALSQIENRIIRASSLTAVPFTLAISGSGQMTVKWFVPNNEQWLIMSAGISLTLDSSQLSVPRAYCFISDGNESFPVFAPAQSITLISGVTGIVSLNLSFNEAGPGQHFGIVAEIVNADAGATHDVTAILGNALVRPFRVVSDIAVAQLAGLSTDPNLRARLRGS